MTDNPNVRDVGSSLQLFVDDWMIERLDGAALRLHQPTREDVAIQFDAPWEGAWCHYVTMIEYGGEFRCYYRGAGQGYDYFRETGEGHEIVTAVATSPDGINWTRPDLGL